MQNAYKAPQPRRMAYGQPGHAHAEQVARDELFAGADPTQQNRQQLGDDMNAQQLMQQAVDTHKETTATAQRALRASSQLLLINTAPLWSVVLTCSGPFTDCGANQGGTSLYSSGVGGPAATDVQDRRRHAEGRTHNLDPKLSAGICAHHSVQYKAC